MVCIFDHFLLSSHASVEVVNCNFMIEGEHACGDTEPRREGMCEIVVYAWKVSPAVE